MEGRTQGEEAVHGSSDDHDEQGHDAKVQELEHETQPLGPAKSGVVRSDNTLGEDQVDEEQQQDTSLSEDAGGDSHIDITRYRGPADAQA